MNGIAFQTVVLVCSQEQLEAFARIMKAEAFEEAAQLAKDMWESGWGGFDIAEFVRQKAKEMK